MPKLKITVKTVLLDAHKTTIFGIWMADNDGTVHRCVSKDWDQYAWLKDNEGQMLTESLNQPWRAQAWAMAKEDIIAFNKKYLKEKNSEKNKSTRNRR